MSDAVTTTTSTTEPRPRFDATRWFRRVTWLLVALGSWSVLAIAAWLRPDARGFGTHQQLGLPPCGFTAVTHIPCPGCGLTTSFAHMAHGHVFAAFGAHLMGPMLFGITVCAAFYAPVAVVRARPLTNVLDTRPAFPVLMVTAGLGVLTFVLRALHVVA